MITLVPKQGVNILISPVVFHNRIYTKFMVNAGLILYGFLHIAWLHIIFLEEF